ncbi:DNA/RNA helicase [Salipaludibacillus keqinensis]|uniref:DNA/RNA helicase n=1 Tax=Salipaludibacillus keqinensis TaxID=2045207 RepID=A0A323TCM4_9BACI|nr:DEAD/DEAH box helicase [Salipaludibacillus keqinensis]PYZ92779.1 DNA/RNA helicase [Salipaludibacillus keqinensis]
MRFYSIPKEERPNSKMARLIPEPFVPIDHPHAMNLLVRLTDLPHNQNTFPQVNGTFQETDELRKMMTGRRLLLDEITALIPLQLIQEHVNQGFIQYESAMMTQPKLTCKRCGNQDPFLFGKIQCARCRQSCRYCRACLMMGRVSQCSPLLTWHGDRRPSKKEHILGWEGTLSPAQNKAAEALKEQVSDLYEGHQEFLVWAVCGSGKTEMLYPAIHKALNQGDPVLVATPRTDVVLELLPRMTAAFPNTKVRAYYGGLEPSERYSEAELVIATTHQLLRFYHHFSLVIIDEVDAFPYTYDAKLQYAVKNARTRASLTVYVTATPPNLLIRQAKIGKLPHVRVPRRYHGHDLPVPKLTWAGNWKKRLEKDRLPFALIFWFREQIEKSNQVFLFVPHIQLMPKVVNGIKASCQQVTVEAVHANDPDRREKVSKFREGATRVLVTTTILERGVTVKGVQVAVFGAEDRIFTESALVQIAGRVGRSPDQPDGDVIFFHHGKTKEMIKAVRHIKLMNKEGIR